MTAPMPLARVAVAACIPSSRVVVLAGAALLGGGRPLPAQAVRPEIGLGVAVPTGALGARRGAGPLARAGLLLGDSARILRARVDGEAMWMPGRNDRMELHDDARVDAPRASRTGCQRRRS